MDLKFDDNFERGLRVEVEWHFGWFLTGGRTFYYFTQQPTLSHSLSHLHILIRIFPEKVMCFLICFSSKVGGETRMAGPQAR